MAREDESLVMVSFHLKDRAASLDIYRKRVTFGGSP
jgi:hypothetical protein